MNPMPSATEQALFLYRLLWAIMAPLLRFHKRMKIGYDERILKQTLPEADLWIQAASVGEAYLVEEILTTLNPAQDLTVLVTTNTSQGLNILKTITPASPHIDLILRYCPFDRPATMVQAVTMVKPRLVVLIESELWPGLLHACKMKEIKVCVVNGRMTEKSMRGYLRMPAIWRSLAPTSILAMSPADGQRFTTVFGKERTTTISNIKFDRILRTTVDLTTDCPLTSIIPAHLPFIILGSIRREEEEDVLQMLNTLLHQNPQLIIGLFPRHMERVNTWHKRLQQDHIPCRLRSHISTPVTQPTVIIWDTIGELQQGYQRAESAFVGGSLAPLGGQNFLESLSTGLRPVIGGSWSNFYWVGEEIFHQQLVTRVGNWQEAARALLAELETPTDRHEIQRQFIKYAQQRQGGTSKACQEIERLLHSA